MPGGTLRPMVRGALHGDHLNRAALAACVSRPRRRPWVPGLRTAAACDDAYHLPSHSAPSEELSEGRDKRGAPLSVAPAAYCARARIARMSRAVRACVGPVAVGRQGPSRLPSRAPLAPLAAPHSRGAHREVEQTVCLFCKTRAGHVRASGWGCAARRRFVQLALACAAFLPSTSCHGRAAAAGPCGACPCVSRTACVCARSHARSLARASMHTHAFSCRRMGRSL